MVGIIFGVLVIKKHCNKYLNTAMTFSINLVSNHSHGSWPSTAGQFFIVPCQDYGIIIIY